MTFLGMSMGEILVVLGTGVVILGREELTTIARVAGRYSGRAVRLIRTTRASVDAFSKRNDLAELQTEMRTTLNQIQALQRELETGIGFSQASTLGPVSRHILGTKPSSVKHAEAAATALNVQNELYSEKVPQASSVERAMQLPSKTEIPEKMRPKTGVESDPGLPSRGLGAFGIDMELHSAGLATERANSGADFVIESVLHHRIAMMVEKESSAPGMSTGSNRS